MQLFSRCLMRNSSMLIIFLILSLLCVNPNRLLADSYNAVSDNDSTLQIIVSADANTYIKGKMVDILITAKNISNRPLEFYPSSLRGTLISVESGIESHSPINYSPDVIPVVLQPNEEYYIKEDQTRFSYGTCYFQKIDNYAMLTEGAYKLRAGFLVNDYLLWSDYCDFRVLPVPDSLKPAFEEFTFEIGNVKKYTGMSYNDEYLEVPKKLQYDYFEKEYLDYAWRYTYYSDALDRGSGAKLYKKASELVEKFILKYPNTSYSSRHILMLLTYRRSPGNLELFNRILTKMTNETTDEVMAKSYKRFMKENRRDILRLFPKFRKFCQEN